MNKKYDAIVIGMGPSGIFLAYELIALKKSKNIFYLTYSVTVPDIAFGLYFIIKSSRASFSTAICDFK